MSLDELYEQFTRMCNPSATPYDLVKHIQERIFEIAEDTKGVPMAEKIISISDSLHVYYDEVEMKAEDGLFTIADITGCSGRTIISKKEVPKLIEALQELLKAKYTIYMEYAGITFFFQDEFTSDDAAISFYLEGSYTCDCNRSKLIRERCRSSFPDLDCGNKIQLIRIVNSQGHIITR